jgi:hypothetical protein
MDSQRLEPECDSLSEAWQRAINTRILLYQLLTNLAALIAFSLLGAIAGILLSTGAAVGVVFGFLVGLIAIGLAGLVMASGAAAILHSVFFPPSSPYDSMWKSSLAFLKRNCAALSSGYGVSFAVFVGVVLVLLVPAATA